jgi:hypothetical protein
MSDAISRLREALGSPTRPTYLSPIKVSPSDLREVLDLLDAAERDASELRVVLQETRGYIGHRPTCALDMLPRIDAAISARASTVKEQS